MELWFMGQGYEDHLVMQEADIPEAKGLYMNDIQRLYKVASSIVNVRQQDMDLSTYIGQIASLKEEFLTVMPLTTDVGDQRTQIDKFFMVLKLIGLRLDLETVRNQILGSSSVPSLDDVFARLLRISSTQTLPSDNTSDSFVLVSQLTLEEDVVVTEVEVNILIAPIAISLATLVIGVISYMGCLPALPTWPGHLILSRLSFRVPPHSQGISLTDSEYDDYLRSQVTKSVSVDSVAQIGNASACLTHTSSLGPWILDSGASDHISGHKDLFSSITTTFALPTVTLANGSQTMAKGIGLAHPLPCLPLTFVLYTPECSFNLISISKITRILNCSITFSDKFVTLQDRSTGKTIGIGRESQGLYHLTSPSTPTVCISTDAPLLIHSCLATLVYLSSRKWSLVFSSLSSLACESSQLGKHARVSFPKRLNNRAKSPLNLSTLMFGVLVGPLHSRPLQAYHRRHRVAVPPSLAEVPANSLPIPSASPAPALPPSADLPIALRKVGCRWVYTVKVGLDGQVDCLKARLAAKGYTQVYGFDYGDTFSPVAKIASVRLFLSMAAMRSWPLYQLDIKNAFLHGDLAEEVYIEQPPGFVAQGFLEFGMFRSTADHSVFYHHNSSGQCIYLVVYVDDIVITGSDQNGDPGRYRRLVGKLNYLTITRPNISFPVSVVSQFLQSPCDSHWDAVIRILRYIKSTPGQGVLYENRGYTQVVGYTDANWVDSLTDRYSTSGYCVFIGGNLISWKSKKQDVVARSSVEAEYRAMALATCELICLKHLLRELRFGKDEQMKLICDNQATLHIASDPVFHERTKHIEVDYHFIREKIASGCVTTSFVNSNDQPTDIFTKSLRDPRIKYICNKLGAYNIYAPA
ncbi:Retrovirus-related Pol polyprotein from transposon RE2 [Vitis vinifera]|uniref:Retrovirus-related Pol polyprotein from transposon RE2 n=1 Tax=Vitis vinifera TaxID=29760 RepID=A0A438GQS8_VITVI|nr:Retrovirus-related Pol polyprotein from transposon RE2 [Vitis vinifera]